MSYLFGSAHVIKVQKGKLIIDGAWQNDSPEVPTKKGRWEGIVSLTQDDFPPGTPQIEHWYTYGDELIVKICDKGEPDLFEKEIAAPGNLLPRGERAFGVLSVIGSHKGDYQAFIRSPNLKPPGADKQQKDSEISSPTSFRLRELQKQASQQQTKQHIDHTPNGSCSIYFRDWNAHDGRRASSGSIVSYIPVIDEDFIYPI